VEEVAGCWGKANELVGKVQHLETMAKTQLDASEVLPAYPREDLMMLYQRDQGVVGINANQLQGFAQS
jgi:hypothetical protein